MPALDPPIITAPKRAVGSLVGISSRGWGAIISAQNDGIDAVWHNPQATPQQVCDELGTLAVPSFDEHGRLTDFIVAQNIIEGKSPLDRVKLPTFAFTRNQNGTVTVDPNTPYVAP